MTYIDYNITQTGKVLSSDKIKINKFDNRVSRLTFSLDGTIPGRLYIALKNPITKSYTYGLLTDDAYIIGSEISNYVGRWDILLIAVSEDYDLDEAGDIDQEKLTYVSNELKKIVVIDNFLDDNCEKISHPAIDAAIDDFARNRDELENNLLQSGNDVTACEEILEQCKDILAQCKEILDGITYAATSLESSLNNSYITYHDSLQQQYNTYLSAVGGGE